LKKKGLHGCCLACVLWVHCICSALQCASICNVQRCTVPQESYSPCVVKRLGCGCNPGHAGVTGSIPTTVENCGLYILGRLSVTSAQVASRQGGGGLGGLPLFMCPRVIIIQACVSRPQTAPPSQGAGPMGGILWRYGEKGGPYGLLLLLLLLLCLSEQSWSGVVCRDLIQKVPSTLWVQCCSSSSCCCGSVLT
jgi:hypothetical protein